MKLTPAATVASFLRASDLRLFYAEVNGYHLVDRDDNILMSFSENFSSTNNSMRHSVQMHQLPSGITLNIYQMFGDNTPREVLDLESVDASVLNFIQQCYYNSIDFQVKGNAFYECAREIQKTYGMPYEVCKLLAGVYENKRHDVAFELDSVRLYSIASANVEHFSKMLRPEATKTQKRSAFKELLSTESYYSLRLDMRGTAYLNALSEYVLSNVCMLDD